MNDASIRLATREDVPPLMTLYREFHAFHVSYLPLWLREPDASDDERLRAALLDILANGSAAIFVAEAGGTTIGLAEVYLRQDEASPYLVPHRFGYLQSLFVSAPWRGKGLGAALLDAARTWALRRGATQMRLSTWEFAEGPLRFYEKRGYKTVKRILAADLA